MKDKNIFDILAERYRKIQEYNRFLDRKELSLSNRLEDWFMGLIVGISAVLVIWMWSIISNAIYIYFAYVLAIMFASLILGFFLILYSFGLIVLIWHTLKKPYVRYYSIKEVKEMRDAEHKRRNMAYLRNNKRVRVN